MKRFIIDQDREQAYSFTGDFYSNSIEHDGVYFGINLYQRGTNDEEQFLGTFDSIKETIDEINNIINSELEAYVVSGYSNYETNEDDEKILKGWCTML